MIFSEEGRGAWISIIRPSLLNIIKRGIPLIPYSFRKVSVVCQG